MTLALSLRALSSNAQLRTRREDTVAQSARGQCDASRAPAISTQVAQMALHTVFRCDDGASESAEAAACYCFTAPRNLAATSAASDAATNLSLRRPSAISTSVCLPLASPL